ncbi:MAG: hypothetical protein V1776_05255 [Candidatus Diapherotrites archaeon]
MNGKHGSELRINPHSRIKMINAAKAPDVRLWTNENLAEKKEILPPKRLTRDERIRWYSQRDIKIRSIIRKENERKMKMEDEFRKMARKEGHLSEEAINKMEPLAIKLFRVEMRLHRMEILALLHRTYWEIEERNPTPEESKRIWKETQDVIESYRNVEREMIEMINHSTERKGGIRDMIIRSLRKKRD